MCWELIKRGKLFLPFLLTTATQQSCSLVTAYFLLLFAVLRAFICHCRDYVHLEFKNGDKYGRNYHDWILHYHIELFSGVDQIQRIDKRDIIFGIDPLDSGCLDDYLPKK